MYLHTISDKYVISDLCNLAGEKFAANAHDQWYTNKLAEAIAQMYETSPNTRSVLHRTAIEVASKNAEKSYRTVACQRLRGVAGETPNFMFKLFGTLIH